MEKNITDRLDKYVVSKADMKTNPTGCGPGFLPNLKSHELIFLP
jgi:hypothetical protein